jgi:FMN phosphatase YigB (HAD superfamily)
MVGDNWKEDILPTAEIGMPSYWITESREPPVAHGLPLVGYGKLADLMTWLDRES